MKRTGMAGLVTLGLLLAGCGSDDAGAHMETLRDLYPTESDAELVATAEAVCGLMESAMDSGASGAEAAARVHDTALSHGLSDADALRFVAATVGGWCPTDISG